MHTQGDWIRDDDTIGVEAFIGGDKVLLPICELQEPSLYHTSDAIMELDANARLILAAPKLLAACKAALSALEGLGAE